MKRLSGPLRGAGVGIVLLVLVFMPFFTGLFFWTELLPAIALVALAFALWIVGRRLGGLSVGVPGGVAGGALLALAGCYALQFAWADYPRGNLDWLLRVLAGWFVLVMFRAEATERLRRVMAWAFVVGAAGVALHGLAEFTGLLAMNHDMLASLSLVGLSERMYTAFQYPNTAAAYLLAMLLLAVGLGVTSGRVWVKGLLTAIGSLIILAFFFAVSRGAIVVVPFGLLMFFGGLERKQWWAALILLGATVVSALVAVGPVGNAAAAHDPAHAAWWILVAVAIGMVFGAVVGLLLRLPVRRQLAVVGIVTVVGLGGLSVTRWGRPLLPVQAQRLLDFNFQTKNAVLRLVWSKDAGHMILDRPLGRGGWGWTRSYRQYSTFDYTARETHNHYAQTAVDSGIPGLLALITAILAGLWQAWKTRKASITGWAMATGVGLIAGHSLIDFNLSFGGVWLLLWSLLGMALPGALKSRREGVANVGAFASALVIMMTATALWQGARLTEQGNRLASEERSAEAHQAFIRATRWDPLDSEAMVQAADHALLLRAVQVDPTSSEAWFKLAVSSELRKEWRVGLNAAKTAWSLDPWKAPYVDKVVRLGGFLMLDELGAGRHASALSLAAELIEVESSWVSRLAKAAPDQPLWGKSRERLDPSTELRFGQAHFLHGDLDRAKKIFIETSKIGLLNSDAEVWLYALYERQDDYAGMAVLENRPWVRFRKSNPVYIALTSSTRE